MNEFIVIATYVNAGAAFVIAIFATCTFFLARRIKARDDEYRQHVSDLFQAIVVSNLISSEKGELTAKIRKFIVL